MVLLRKIGSQMISVYNDAQRTSLSAWSWPSRQIALKFSQEFERNGKFNSDDINFQYLTPSHHSDLLDSIVKTNVPDLRNKIKNAAAVSLRIDGSTDRTQNHNIYVMAHLVAEDLSVSTVFLGFAVPKNGGNAESYYEAVKNSVTPVLPWNELFEKITSVVTDGENLNSGCDKGLWKKMKDDRDKSNNEKPLLFIWCIPHRLNLAWKSLCKDFSIISDLVQDVKNLASFFHMSAEKTQQLKNISLNNPNDFQKYIQYPSYFEIRWTEFTYNLFYSVLRNWKASMQYFVNEDELGLQNRWLNYGRIHLLTFMTDLLTLFKAFQKFFESDSVSIMEVTLKKQKLFDKLVKLKTEPLKDGWEECFLQNIIIDEDSSLLYGNKLIKERVRDTKY